MWAGFAVALSISGLNGLHVLFPSMPHVEWIKQYNIGQFLTTRPWSAAAPFNMSAYPFAVGLAYLMPADLAFFGVVFHAGAQGVSGAWGGDGLGRGGGARVPVFERAGGGRVADAGADAAVGARGRPFARRGAPRGRPTTPNARSIGSVG
jgi:hypothetical protein